VRLERRRSRLLSDCTRSNPFDTPRVLNRLKKIRYLAAILLVVAVLAFFLARRNPARSAEYVLSRTLGAEKSFVIMHRFGAEEGIAFGDSSYAYELTAQTNLTLLSKATKSDSADLQFAKENIEGLLNRSLPGGVLNLFRTSVDNRVGSWSVYALTTTNQNQIYLLVLTM
jgi:hypothetical protein